MPQHAPKRLHTLYMVKVNCSTILALSCTGACSYRRSHLSVFLWLINPFIKTKPSIVGQDEISVRSQIDKKLCNQILSSGTSIIFDCTAKILVLDSSASPRKNYRKILAKILQWGDGWVERRGLKTNVAIKCWCY